MRKMRCLVGLLMLGMVFAVPAWADTTFDFESPTYTAGSALVGQNDWTFTGEPAYSSLVQVVGGSIVNGVQSVAFGEYGVTVRHSIAGQVLHDRSTASVSMKADAVDGCWQMVLMENTAGQPYAYVWVNADGYYYVLNSTHSDWVNIGGTSYYYFLNDKLTVTFIMDYTNSRYKVRVNNETSPALSFVSGWNGFSYPTTVATAAGSVALAALRFWVDDVVVIETPPLPNLDTKIDFEAPWYKAIETTGASLPGQEEWTSSVPAMESAWLVKTTNAISGSQSAHGDWWQAGGLTRPLTGQTFQDGTTLHLKMKVDFNADNLLDKTGGIVQLRGTDGRPYAALWALTETEGGVDKGRIYYLNQGSTEWYPLGWEYGFDDELEITMALDFANQMCKLTYRDVDNPDWAGSAWVPFVFPATPTSAKGSIMFSAQRCGFDDLQITQETLFSAPISIGAAKSTAAENSEVNCTGYVSALYDGWFNIEDGDRTTGIVVAASGAGLSLGQEVQVIGTIQTNAALGERGIYNPIIHPKSGSKIIDPLGMTNKAIGGGASGLQAGVFEGTGMNNVGLLVKTTGRVSAGLGGEYFALDDGSGVTMVVWYGGTHPAIDAYIAATGTVSTLKDGNDNLQRQLILTEFQTITE